MCVFVSMHTSGGRRRNACSFISESVGFCVLLGIRRKTHPQRRAQICRENGCILLTCHAEARGTSAFGGIVFTLLREMRAHSILVELLPAFQRPTDPKEKSGVEPGKGFAREKEVDMFAELVRNYSIGKFECGSAFTA